MQRLLAIISILVVMLPGCGNTPTTQTASNGGATNDIINTAGVDTIDTTGVGTIDTAGVGTGGGAALDSDGDGFSDDQENGSNPGTDPNDPTDNPNNVRDTDGDGCSDYDELTLDGFCNNDPNTPGNTNEPITPEVRAACSTITNDADIALIIRLYKETRAEGFSVDDQVASAQVVCSTLCNGDAICQNLCFVCEAATINFVYGVSDAASRTCPIELDGPGFAVTIPCGFVRVANSLNPIPGATYQRVYNSTDLSLLVAVFPRAQLSTSLPDELVSFRLNGRVTTASGDFLLNVNAEASQLQGEKVVGMLANGDFVVITMVGASFDQDVQLMVGGVFLSIDIQDTDGSGFFDLLAVGANVLQVRPSDGFLVLEDDSVWFVGTDDTAVVAFWNDADLVLRGPPDSSIDDAMFTSMVSWESVDARLCGTGTRAVVAGINEPDFAALEIVLDSGAVLESSFADEDKLLFWQVGDPVSVVTGASCSTRSTYVVNLRTGSTVGIR